MKNIETLHKRIHKKIKTYYNLMADPEELGNLHESLDKSELKLKPELKTDKSGFMKVGDIILIMMKREKYCGMISADGIISNSVTVIPRQSEKEKGANVITRSCLFRVENAMKITKSNKKKADYELKNLLGKAVTYGERVQLQHLHSMTFVSVDTQAMASEAGCLQTIMKDESNENSWFQITAANKLRKEGEVIRYSDNVCFVSVSKKSQYYLHVDESIALKEYSRAEVNASGNISSWIIRRYTSYDLYDDSSNFVRIGDSFRIFHKIIGGYLCAKKSSEDAPPEVFVQRRNLKSSTF